MSLMLRPGTGLRTRATDLAQAAHIVVPKVPRFDQTYCESKDIARMNRKKDLLEEDEEENSRMKELAKELNELSIEESIGFIREEFYAAHDKQNFTRDLSSLFSVWKKYLDAKMNICLFGIGSKTRSIEAFLQKYYSQQIVIKIKGFNSSVKVDNILMKILQTLEPFSDSNSRTDLARLLSQKRHKSDKTINIINNLLNTLQPFGIKIVIAFFDMDGKHFREAESHEVLCKVFGHPSISLIGSFSNVNFPYILSQDTVTAYNFVFLPAHTLEPSEVELLSDEIYWFNKKQTKGANAIWAIYRALTEAQKEVLKLLAEHISKSASGQLTYRDFYELCFDEMIISNENQLTECLKEAIAHSVVIEKMGENGERLLRMPNATEAFNVFSKTQEEEDEM